MVSQTPPTIGILQKLDLVPAILQTCGQTLFAVLVAPFKKGGDESMKRYAMLALMRSMLTRMSTEQLQFVSGLTVTRYEAWTKAAGLPAKEVNLTNPDTKAFWIGDSNADTVIVYYHGGGFAMPGSPGQFEFLSQVLSKGKESGKSVGGLFLDYDLAPKNQYPHQLSQGVEVLRYVLTDLKKSPEKVILGGDSAGGNLVFGVLNHLLHPHPEIKPIQLSQPLKAAYAISPMVEFGMTGPGFNDQSNDPASAYSLRLWAKNYVGQRKLDGWNDPAQNDVKQWQGLDSVVKDVLITYATGEMMSDGIRGMASKVAAAHPKVTTFPAKGDFHAEPSIGIDAGTPEGEAARLIKPWIAERL